MATTPRFTGAKNTENTAVGYQFDYQTPAYAATIALAIKGNAAETVVQPAALTGAATITANVGSAGVPPYVGDALTLLLQSDATTRTVTFGTGFAPTAATIVVTTAKYALVTFIFNGTVWVEQSRAVTA